MTVEIKVDVVGQMRLFRTATFQNRYPFLEEAIQNSQRAKATELKFHLSQDELVVSDNGVGLSSPEDLFTIAHSGWSEETKKDQKPFGIGFFSCVKMANKIVIESNKFRILFDVNKVIEEGRTDLDVEEPEEPVNGFRVTLSEFLEPISLASVWGELRKIGRYVKLDISLNDLDIPKGSYLETDQSPFASTLIHEDIEGWLRPYNYFDGDSSDLGYPPRIQIYYQDRFVKDLILAPYLAGVIALKNSEVVDLRAPDRKEFIDNHKFERLKTRLFKETRALCIRLLLYGSSTDLDKYQQLIESQLSTEEYAEYLNYLVLNTPEALITVLEGTKTLPRDLVQDIINDIGRPAFNLQPSEDIEATYNSEWVPPSDEQIETFGLQGLQGTEREGDPLPQEGRLYYVGLSELPTYAETVTKALKARISVIIARNNLEIEAIKLRGNINHIKDINQTARAKIRFKAVGPLDPREKRALWLLNIVSRTVGLDHNPFMIGELELTKTTILGDRELGQEILRPFGVTDRKTIMIDRSKLQSSSLRPSFSKELTYSDLQFIGRNIDTIAHELAHYIYDTDDETPTHYKVQLILTSEILGAVFDYQIKKGG